MSSGVMTTSSIASTWVWEVVESGVVSELLELSEDDDSVVALEVDSASGVEETVELCPPAQETRASAARARAMRFFIAALL